ncbi:MAG: hypothetical protein OXG84_08030 [Chloroflexi bacterium]|nr:hypothetical protein [Chloroflexota bacterium]
MNDKEQIELVKIAGRLNALEQDVGQLKVDVSQLTDDVSEMKKDMVYMRGQIDVIVQLLGSVVSLIKIPDD